MAQNADTGESKYVSPSFLTMKQQWQCLWGKKNEQLANVVSSAEQTRRQACSEWAQVGRRDLAWPGQDCSVRAPIARPCFSSVKLHSMENSSFSESKSHVASPYALIHTCFIFVCGARSPKRTENQNCCKWNAQSVGKIYRPWQDSNLQSPDPKSGALSIKPHNPTLVDCAKGTQNVCKLATYVARHWLLITKTT